VAAADPTEGASAQDLSGKEPGSRTDWSKAKTLSKTIGKYLLHGTLFSILLTAFSFGFVFVLAFLVIIGYVLGLILAIAILCLIIGFINSLVTSMLWFRVKTGWKVFLGHGFLLGIVLFTVQVVPGLFVWGLTGTPPVIQDFALRIPVAAAYALIDGVIGKRIARIWQVGPERGRVARTRHLRPELASTMPKNPDRLQCPRCGGTRLVVEADRSAFCIDCGRGIHPTLWTARSSS
jgi:hypothetical protein